MIKQFTQLPHFYIINWGLQGYSLFFLLLLENIDCGYSLELPPKTENFQIKTGIFHISDQNIDCGYS